MCDGQASAARPARRQLNVEELSSGFLVRDYTNDRAFFAPNARDAGLIVTAICAAPVREQIKDSIRRRGLTDAGSQMGAAGQYGVAGEALGNNARDDTRAAGAVQEGRKAENTAAPEPATEGWGEVFRHVDNAFAALDRIAARVK